MSKEPNFPDWLAAICQLIGYGILAVIIFWAFTGCNPARWCSKHSPGIAQSDTIIRDSVIYRDTLLRIAVASDSGYLTALLSCQGDKAKLMQIVSYGTGNHANAPQIIIKDNYLTAICRVDSFSVYREWRSKDVYRSIKTSAVIVRNVNYVTKWQSFWIRFGQITGGLILLFVLIKYGWPLIRKAIFKV